MHLLIVGDNFPGTSDCPDEADCFYPLMVDYLTRPESVPIGTDHHRAATLTLVNISCFIHSASPQTHEIHRSFNTC
jgi:hypothetical protein